MKIICIGRNYAEHARELNNAIPEEPIIFMKPKTALLTDGKPLFYPDFTNDLQYEGELVLRIGKNGKYIQEKFARRYYNGITVGIDFTARDVQKKLKEKGLPWEIAKGFDGSAAVGNFINLDEKQSINDFRFELKLNGETRQIGDPNQMIFSPEKIIAYVSQFFMLNIGDLIFTGTPSGVGGLTVTDELLGYLNGQEVLQCTIK
jgi:2-keto-4-pentenoate hydratase/2-oxohepta-3-ene-1,7-dioic acid hydratase in catechol pathway